MSSVDLEMIFSKSYLYILWPEEELPVEIGLLDDVHVSDIQPALGAARQSHHGKVLQQLTADGTRSNLTTWEGENS